MRFVFRKELTAAFCVLHLRSVVFELCGVMSGSLCPVSVLRVCAVLLDSADQLAVLGHIMSVTNGDTTAAAAAATAVSEAISRVLEQYGDDAFHLWAARGGGMCETVQKRHRELERCLMDSLISSDYMTKVKSDWWFAARLIGKLLTELKEEGTFYSLIHTVEEENRRKAQLHHIIKSEEEDRLRIKTLQEQLHVTRRDTTLQIQERDKMAAYLEDQLQEQKMKKSLQEKYMNDSTELFVYQGQKLNSYIEKQLEDEIETLKKKLTEEEKAHGELEAFFKNSQTSLEENLEYWMERYDRDTEDKQRELNTIKTNMSNTRAQLQDLAKKYRECERVITEDRQEKEKLRKQLEKEQLERKAAIKIQSWWRGTMVRKGLGPFKKGKKSKQKKDGKKGKKKK
ncbi:dynein regulatory complex protein 9 [Ictalurus furcatus]|uniref:dynein regulatory complex protein 9 n=1 Tax=Ictalurus furcatus TaxID=66913 RepID=UPI00234FF9D6|nr:dynein regulatory complex protein 9 [Ictalurus furcatus]